MRQRPAQHRLAPPPARLVSCLVLANGSQATPRAARACAGEEESVGKAWKRGGMASHSGAAVQVGWWTVRRTTSNMCRASGQRFAAVHPHKGEPRAAHGHTHTDQIVLGCERKYATGNGEKTKSFWLI